MDQEKLENYISQYFDYLENNFEERYEQEGYKWEASKTFRDNFDVNAEDLHSMLEKSLEDFGNLVQGANWFPKNALLIFAKKVPEETIKLFQILFDEEQSLVKRINFFIKESNEIKDKKRLFKNKSDITFFDYRFLSILLTSYNPKKYIHVKSMLYNNALKELGYDLKKHGLTSRTGQGEKYQKYLFIADEIRSMLENKRGKTLEKKFIDKSGFNDFGAWFTQDFLCWINDEVNKEENNEEEGENNTDQNKTRYWIFAPGPKAEKWDEFYKSGVMAIGWDKLGDLSEYETKDEVKDALKKEYKEKNPTNNTFSCWSFGHEMKEGDVVYVKKGRNNLIGKGIIKSDYIYDESKNEYRHIRKVEWVKKGKWETDKMTGVATITEAFKEQAKEFEDKMNKVDLEKQSIQEIYEKISENGFIYDPALIANFYISLKTKPFVILAGNSGTGKSALVRQFAKAIYGNEYENYYSLIPVRPNWNDPSDLLGYRNPMSGEWVDGELTKVIRKAIREESVPFFVCLDEMNIAHVEYYFSDILSRMESREIRDGKIFTDYFREDDEIRDLYLPSNLFIIGTVNIDETTHPLSKKVLDRANTIEIKANLHQKEFEKIDLPKKKEYLLDDLKIKASDPDFKISNPLEWDEILDKYGFGFGHRTLNEINLYGEHAARLGFSEKDVLDFQFLQKVLPKIHGNSEKVRKVLEEFLNLYKEGDVYIFPRSAKKIQEMINQFDEDGFTTFWN